MRSWGRQLLWAVLLAAAGCRSQRIALDLSPMRFTAIPLDTTAAASAEPLPAPKPDPSDVQPKPDAPAKFEDRLKIPPELPGSEAPPIPISPDPAKRVERAEAIRKFYDQPLPPLPAEIRILPGPSGAPLSLAELQALAAANHPKLKQAAADVDSARGAMIQAGLPPNPTIGYEADTIGSGNTAGQQGGYIEQLIKTGGKLRLAQAAAAMEWRNAQVAFRRTQVDLAASVRSDYFAVLIAQENLRVSRAVAKLTEETFRLHVERVTQAKIDAPYEPMQLRVLVVQARANVIQAQNRYVAAWKTLAATLNQPEIAPALLAGRPDMPVPQLQYADVLPIMLGQHTDVAAAGNDVLRAQYQLRFAEVAPIPDVMVRSVIQKDYTTPPFNTTVNIEASIPVPIFDRNQGGRLQAQGQLARAVEQLPKVRNDLTQKLAEAFERYSNGLYLVNYYRSQILPDQVRTYRGLLGRYQVEPDRVTLYDIVNAQQALAAATQNYLTALGAVWQAVVDIAALAQVDDLFAAFPAKEVTPVPELEHGR